MYSKAVALPSSVSINSVSVGGATALAKCKSLLFFIGYKNEYFSFQINPKNLDPSYRYLGLFRKGKICNIAKFQRTDLLFVVFLGKGKSRLTAEKIQ